MEVYRRIYAWFTKASHSPTRFVPWQSCPIFQEENKIIMAEESVKATTQRNIYSLHHLHGATLTYHDCFYHPTTYSGIHTMQGVLDTHNVNVLGSGEQSIVLCHGFGLDQSVWKYVVPHLVDDFRVILFDNMGAGTTNPDYFDFERYSTVEGYAFDLIAILDELNITSCIYIGHSVSCIAGIVASIYRPHLFPKLVLLAASPRYLNDVDYNGGFTMEELEQLFNAMRANYKAWCSGFASFAVGGDLDSPAVQEFSRTLFNMRPDIALSVAQTIFQSDLRAVLERVTVPCHIVQSHKDLAVPLEVSEYLHHHLGGKSVVEIMETEGHLPQLSAPAIAIPVLLKHIRENIAS